MRLAMSRPRLSDESGFTITELLVTCIIGVLILGSATQITIGAARHNNEVANRSDASQRGRLALELIQRSLRSQVCTTTSTYPISSAKRDSITYTSQLSDGSKPVERHTIAVDAGTRKLTDTVVKGAGSPVTFTGTPKVRTLATDVVAVDAATPTFRYWAYPNPVPTTGIVQPTVTVTPSGTNSLSTTDIGRVAKVDINFATTGAAKTLKTIRVPQTDSVFVRIADPDDAAGVYTPSCG